MNVATLAALIVSFLVYGVCLLAVSGILRRVLRRVLRWRKKKPKADPNDDPAAEFFCGCGHHLAFHAGGECHAAVSRLISSHGGHKTWEIRSCTCQRYIGLIPLEDELDKFLSEGRNEPENLG